MLGRAFGIGTEQATFGVGASLERGGAIGVTPLHVAPERGVIGVRQASGWLSCGFVGRFVGRFIGEPIVGIGLGVVAVGGSSKMPPESPASCSAGSFAEESSSPPEHPARIIPTTAKLATVLFTLLRFMWM